jgi:UDP-N-acetylmuramoylalanine--D-glutamate ligase
MSWSGKRVLVVGLGVSGLAAARALLSLGAKVSVTEMSASVEVTERADSLRRDGAEVEVGGHDLVERDFDAAVLSPGIPLLSPVVTALQRRAVKVLSEVELAYSVASCDFLAVTGTNGKTTTTTLLADILRAGDVQSIAAGNIGHPLVDAALSIPAEGAIAVEVSSFQLATIETFRPRVAAVLNVAEDHTDWHGSFESYAGAKGRITENQKSDDVLVYNLEDHHAVAIAASSSARTVPFSTLGAPATGIGLHDGTIVYLGQELMAANDIPLAGEAGLEDCMAAAAIALEYGVDPSAVTSAIRAFRPLPHRLQIVAEADGVTYIDDSKATNPHATVAAVKGLHDVVLIAGGRSKGIDLAPLTGAVPPVRAVVAMGEARDEIAALFEGLVPVDVVDSMDEAVARAVERSNGKGSVLLSPGCASLDMFTGYAARGEAFVTAVKNLMGQNGGSDGDA